MDPRVYLPRIIAAAIAALLKYVGVEVGEETGITPELLDGVSLFIALAGYAAVHKKLSKSMNPGDVAQERRGHRVDDSGAKIPTPHP